MCSVLIKQNNQFFARLKPYKRLCRYLQTLVDFENRIMWKYVHSYVSLTFLVTVINITQILKILILICIYVEQQTYKILQKIIFLWNFFFFSYYRLHLHRCGKFIIFINLHINSNIRNKQISQLTSFFSNRW